jgi:NAD(P)-dependent dehydrogenase (short-subunit alcohol dehydrogenase family)
MTERHPAQRDPHLEEVARHVAGKPSDGADLITYLCREESGYIIGATYDVNGGSHIH